MASASVSAPNALPALAKSSERSLLAANKSPMTEKSYLDAARLSGELLTGRRMPTRVEAIRREHVEEFLTDQLRRWKPATAQSR